MADLSINFAGIKSPNPFWLASACDRIINMSILLDKALELPIPERIRLVEDIWDSIAAVPEAVKLTDEQMAEIERRLEDYRKDPENVIPWQEAKQRLRRIA